MWREVLFALGLEIGGAFYIKIQWVTPADIQHKFADGYQGYLDFFKPDLRQ